MRVRLLPVLLSAAALAALAACADAPTQSTPSVTTRPSFREEGDAEAELSRSVLPPLTSFDGVREGENGERGLAGTAAAGIPISYHGGPILTTPKVVAVYWSSARIYSGTPAPGTWGASSTDNSLIGYFLRNLGATAYWNINSTYYNGAGVRVPRSLQYTQVWTPTRNAPAAGTTVSDAQIRSILNFGFANGRIAYDVNTVYVVFTGTKVNLGGGFGTQYCAYHTAYSYNGKVVKYAAQPYNADFPNGCAAQTRSPNGDFAADVEVNTLAHEVEEATTDPNLDAWYDANGEENADKCAWTFGTTYTTANGAAANMMVGTKDFLVQRNWGATDLGCLTKY